MAGSKFVRHLDDGHQKEFARLFDAACESKSRWGVFEDFVLMSAIAVSNVVDKRHSEAREARYMRKVEEYSKRELDLFPRMLGELTLSLEQNPAQDFMGKMFMNLELGNDKKGQFFTPYNVSRAMAEMQITAESLSGQIEGRGWVSVSDPACGAGGMLIAAANAIQAAGYSYQTQALFVGQDIDETAGCMCYLQMSLLGLPGYVVVDNTLTKPALFVDKDGLIPVPGENVWYTPMYFREVWEFRRGGAMLSKALDAISAPVSVD